MSGVGFSSLGVQKTSFPNLDLVIGGAIGSCLTGAALSTIAFVFQRIMCQLDLSSVITPFSHLLFSLLVRDLYRTIYRASFTTKN